MDTQAVICDLNGANRSFIEDWALTVIVRLSGYHEVDMQVIPSVSGAGEIAIAQRTLKIYRSSGLCFFGRIWEPLLWSPTSIQIKAKSAIANLDLRRIQPDGSGNGPAYAAQDKGAIMWNLISLQNSRWTTHLQMGTIEASTLSTLQYDPGKVVTEGITQLMATDGGPFYREDPVDGVPGVWGSFNALYPNSGSDQQDVKFEYGAGTLENLADYQREDKLPINRVLAIGAGSGPDKVTGVATDAGSQATFDLIEDEISFTDISDVAVLNSKALDALRPFSNSTWKLTPNANAPRLWDDFNVGDTVHFTVKEPPLDETHTARVTEAQVKFTQSGVELLDNLTIELLT